MKEKININNVGFYDTETTYNSTVITDGELIENCKVQIWRNSATGKNSVGWYRKRKDDII